MRKYKIVGVSENNALTVELCCNYRYAVFAARQLLAECENVSIYQAGKRLKTLIR